MLDVLKALIPGVSLKSTLIFALLLVLFCSPCFAEQLSLGFSVCTLDEIELPVEPPKLRNGGAIVSSVITTGPAFV